jgi:hypothetical protein
MTYLNTRTADICAIGSLKQYIDLLATTTAKRTAIFVVLTTLLSTFLSHDYFECFVKTLSIKPYSLASAAESQ